MPDTTWDPVADRLAEIRVDRDLASELPMTKDIRRVIDRQVPQLIAVVDATLTEHSPSGRWCVGCDAVWPCPTYQGVFKALLGEECAVDSPWLQGTLDTAEVNAELRAALRPGHR